MTYREMVDMINVYIEKQKRKECYQVLIELERDGTNRLVAEEFSRQLEKTSDVKAAFLNSLLKAKASKL
jgi:hypothetical protein